MRKSQVSVFIIIAIVLVAIIGIYFAFRTNVLNIGNNIAPEVAPVYSYVDNCVKQTGQDAIYYIGQTGGYFLVPNESSENHIAYYLYNNKNLIPDKERIEKELADYMNEMLFFCTDNFIGFSDFQIKQGDIKTTAKIDNGNVVFDVDYPLSISKSNTNYNINKFETKISARLDVVYGTAFKIMDEQMKNKQDICLNCIQELADNNNLYVDMYDYKENVVVFVITDPQSKINEKDFEFQFANFYKS